MKSKQQTAAQVNRLGISAKELWDMEINEIPMLVGPILPKCTLATVAGSSDTGKSSFLRQLATHIVLGKEEFLGFKITPTHQKVIYVSTEDDQYSIAYLLRKQNEDLSSEDQVNLENLVYVFDAEKLIEKLGKYLEETPVDLVIIDAFSDVFNGELNMASSIRPYLNQFGDLAKKFDCAVVFLHHTGKRTQHLKPSKDNLLGSQGFEAKMRLVIELRKDLHDTSKRHLCIVKGNYLAEEQKSESYELIFDENMRFSNTGQRLAFEKLIPINNGDPKKQAAIEYAKELKSQCRTIDEITQEVSKVYKVGRTTVSKWVKDIPCQASSNDEEE